MIVRVSEAPGAHERDAAAVTPLQAMFDEAACSALAGPAAFLRGVSLALRGAVSHLRLRPDSATGQVTADYVSSDQGVAAFQGESGVGGGSTYEVRLLALLDEADRPSGASYTCSCTHGSGGPLCAHAVAVALVATGSVDPEDDQARDTSDEYVDYDGAVAGDPADIDADTYSDIDTDTYSDSVAVQEFLLALSRAELVDLVLDLAEVNDGLADDLRATSARWHRPTADF